MPLYSVFGQINASKYLGTVEAANEKEAIDKAWDEMDVGINVCHYCSKEVGDPEITDIHVDKVVEDGSEPRL